MKRAAMKLLGVILLALSGCYLFLGMHPRWRLPLDPWLSAHQKRKLREVLGRAPMGDDEFIVWMEQEATDEWIVSKVRQRVAEGVAYLVGHSVNASLIYPRDGIVADLGIGAGPDLDDTAIIITLEKDFGISLPDQETEKVLTVADLVHLCERRIELTRFPSNTDRT
jgi:hypothetical protein